MIFGDIDHTVLQVSLLSLLHSLCLGEGGEGGGLWLAKAMTSIPPVDTPAES